YFYQYRLKRSTAQVTIFTRPRGARVFIDERLVGETPFAGTIDVSKHKLLLEHRDYPWHREELDVQPGAPVKRELTLTRPIRSGRTELVIASMVFGGAAGPLLLNSVLGNSQFGNSGLGLLVYMVASGAGIGAGFLGSFLATRDGLSRGHVGLIDVGGVAGTGLGFALGYVIGVNSGKSEDNIQVGARYALGGMALGLLAGAVLTRKYKGDVPPVEALLRRDHGHWALGIPSFSVEQAMTPEGTAPRISLTLARGTW